MSKIEDIADSEFDKLLQQVQLGKHDVLDLRIDKWGDMSKELLGVASASADGTFCWSGGRGLTCKIFGWITPTLYKLGYYWKTLFLNR